VIYGGDLIEISSGNLASGEAVIQRQTATSQVVLDKPLPEVRTNLSKLRFENQVDSHQSRPIRYGDLIHIKHSALVNNKLQSRFIKYGERVQSHQEGPVFEVFKLIKVGRPESVDYVSYGDLLMIGCGDQPSNKIYLKMEEDKSLRSDATTESATQFKVFLLRPFDSTSQCVSQNETIFP